MKYIDIENNIKLDFKINDRPYVIKQYAKDWYAYNNWSFEFLKNLDPEHKMKVNAVIGNMYSGENKFVSINLKDYIEKYDLDDLRLSSHTFKLHKVKEGQGYHVWHYENDGLPDSCQRVLAWMTYLRVPEKGGETEFLCQSKRIEPVVGRTLIWPAYFTHLHRGNPPLKGEKHYITGWFESGIGFTPTGE